MIEFIVNNITAFLGKCSNLCGKGVFCILFDCEFLYYFFYA